jgi:hypothetical protein
MKLLLSVTLFFTIGLNINQAQQAPVLNISTFKKIPDELMGCGDCYYLSQKDKKQSSFVCVTDYAFALIYIDHKPIRLKANENISHGKNEEIYTLGRYILSIRKVDMNNLIPNITSSKAVSLLNQAVKFYINNK